VQVPASVLAQYQSVNAQADQTATQPFQDYSGQFVAPVNAQQQQGIVGTNAAATEAQPYYGAATGQLGQAQANTQPANSAALGLAGASAQQVNASPLTGQQINQYMSPYLQDVMGSTQALQNQSNQEQQAGQLGTAIQSGAFGGDRTGIAAANLEQQQNLTNANVLSGIANTGYNNALSTAQQQQGVNLSAGQANRAALGSAATNIAGIGQTQYGEGANTASSLASLGSGAQTAGLQGASAQLGAGTVEQQTQQAQDTAQYNQFLQQQSYPFQVDQFLANIAEGTGALSGSTTTTSQPGGFFSDERLKSDKKPIGKTFDGQTIYSYKMHGDPRTQIGLMAQDVEDKHPEAVGLAGSGYKTVDYEKATKKAANDGHFYAGGVVPMRRAAGGPVDPGDYSSILAAQQQMYSGLSGARTMGGSPRGGAAGVPAASVPVGHLDAPSGGLQRQPSGAQNLSGAMTLANQGNQIYKNFSGPSQQPQQPTPTKTGSGTGTWDTSSQAGVGNFDGSSLRRGGIAGYDSGGSTPYESAGFDIPDENSHNALTKPAALPPKSPSGFQQLMSMGSGMGGMSSMMGGLGGASGASGGADAASDAGDSMDAVDAAEIAARGGRIHRDAGGDAVTADSTDLQSTAGSDAPATGIAQSPGLAQGAPNTSLNSVKHLALAAGEAYLGDYAGAAGQAYEAYGAAKNKRGGRIHKDVAGGVGDDDTLPEIQADVPTKQFQGVSDSGPAYTGGVNPAPMPAVDAGATPSANISTDDSGLKGPSWWDRNKGNIIPLAQGLAAMGTAPTKHLGVALAAGLGAGAQSYVPTQQGLANTQQTQTQTQGMDIANQIAQQKLNYLKSPPPSGGTPSPISQPQQSDPTPLPDQLRKMYAVAPVTQSEAQQLQYAHKQAVALGSDQPVQAVHDAISNRTTAQTFKVQQDARQNYDAAVFTANHSKDPAIRASAAATADAYRQWTGDEPGDQNGVTVNKRTGQPFIGEEAQRLPPGRYAEMMAQAQEKIPMPTGNAADPGETALTPRYKVAGFNDAQSYVASLPPPGTPGIPGGAPSAGQGAPTAIPQQPRSVGAPAAVAQRPAGVRRQSTAAPASAAPVDPIAAKAFGDSSYDLPKIPNRPGVTIGEGTRNKVLASNEKRKELQADAEQTAQASGAALQYATAAKQIMASKGAPTTGFLGPVAKAISSVYSGVDATNYQEVAKYLGNLAVQAGKGNFPHATEKENMVQFEQLSPSTANTPDALNNLLDSNIKTAKYTLDTADRAGKYLDQNKDPQKFFRWNQQYYPREDISKAAAPAAAIQHLKSHPELADAFKTKYGYLP
jgi:hypothetical protein